MKPTKTPKKLTLCNFMFVIDVEIRVTIKDRVVERPKALQLESKIRRVLLEVMYQDIEF